MLLFDDQAMDDEYIDDYLQALHLNIESPVDSQTQNDNELCG